MRSSREVGALPTWAGMGGLPTGSQPLRGVWPRTRGIGDPHERGTDSRVLLVVLGPRPSVPHSRCDLRHPVLDSDRDLPEEEASGWRATGPRRPLGVMSEAPPARERASAEPAFSARQRPRPTARPRSSLASRSCSASSGGESCGNSSPRGSAKGLVVAGQKTIRQVQVGPHRWAPTPVGPHTSGPRGARTRNLRIKSPQLYH